MTPPVSRSKPVARTAKPDDRDAERLRLALLAAEIGVHDWDPVRGTLDWSERCKAMFGLEPDAPVDRRVFLSRVHPDDRAPLAAAEAAALDPEGSGAYRIELRALWPDGTVRWIDARGRASFADLDGGRRAVRLIGAMLDVTDRKGTDAVLRESEARTRLALSAARLSYWTWDLLTGEVVLGPGSKALLGIPDHHVVDRYEDFERFVH